MGLLRLNDPLYGECIRAPGFEHDFMVYCGPFDKSGIAQNRYEVYKWLDKQHKWQAAIEVYLSDEECEKMLRGRFRGRLPTQ